MQENDRRRGKKTLVTCVMLASSSLAVAQTPPVSAQTAGEQDQRVRQQQEAREREQAINAPAVRGAATPTAGFISLPIESPCFRIQSFALDVPSTLPDAVRARGASSLPMDQFAFAREWLEHYVNQCVGKQGLDLLVKGLSQTILSRGYVTTRVLVPEQDMSSGTLKLADRKSVV